MDTVTSDPDSTSASLIRRACRFDEAAWRRLSAVYGPLVYRWCRRAGLQEADAADVLQEVFRAVLTGIANFRRGQGGGFRGWLYGVTRHKLADHFRRSSPTQIARDAAELLWSGGSADDGIESTAIDPAEERALLLHAMLDAIRDDFDPHNWEAFERTALHGESALQVAADLAMSPTAVRQAKFRILRRLRREFAEWE